jgi:aryl-alcohol dehydrogenase-like predicted oxidoreductase
MQATTVEHRKIGALEVSLTGLGCNNFGWRIDGTQSARVVAAALDSGINFFDTADIYDKGHKAASPGAHFVSVQNEYNLFHREPEAEVFAGMPASGIGVPALFSDGEWPAYRQIPQRPTLAQR